MRWHLHGNQTNLGELLPSLIGLLALRPTLSGSLPFSRVAVVFSVCWPQRYASDMPVYDAAVAEWILFNDYGEGDGFYPTILDETLLCSTILCNRYNGLFMREERFLSLK